MTGPENKTRQIERDLEAKTRGNSKDGPAWGASNCARDRNRFNPSLDAVRGQKVRPRWIIGDACEKAGDMMRNCESFLRALE
jgi:hypothetical protein